MVPWGRGVLASSGPVHVTSMRRRSMPAPATEAGAASRGRGWAARLVLHQLLHVHAHEELAEPRVGQHLLVQQLHRRQHRRPAAQALVDGLGALRLRQDGPVRALRTQPAVSAHAGGASTAGRPPRRWWMVVALSRCARMDPSARCARSLLCLQANANGLGISSCARSASSAHCARSRLCHCMLGGVIGRHGPPGDRRMVLALSGCARIASSARCARSRLFHCILVALQGGTGLHEIGEACFGAVAGKPNWKRGKQPSPGR